MALAITIYKYQEMDVLAGQPNTAGFISGYQGSPLGTYDQHLRRAENFLQAADIHFSPGFDNNKRNFPENNLVWIC